MGQFDACRMAKRNLGFLLLLLISPLKALPGAKPLAKSDPGHLVHDFYKCLSPVYRLSPECQQQQRAAPQYRTQGRIFSEGEHFIEGGGDKTQQHVVQNSWPAVGFVERKNERMMMPSLPTDHGQSLTPTDHGQPSTTTVKVMDLDAEETSKETTLKPLEVS